MQIRSMHSLDTNTHGKTTTILFTGEIDYREVTTLGQKLNDLVKKCSFLRVDLQNCESFEFSFLLLILSLFKTLKHEDTSFEVVRVSPAFVDSLLLLGIPLDLLNIDLAESGSEY